MVKQSNMDPQQLYELGLLDQDKYLDRYREEYSKEIKVVAARLHLLFCPACIKNTNCDFNDADIHLKDTPDHVTHWVDIVIKIMKEYVFWGLRDLDPIIGKASSAMNYLAALETSPTLFTMTINAVHAAKRETPELQSPTAVDPAE